MATRSSSAQQLQSQCQVSSHHPGSSPEQHGRFWLISTTLDCVMDLHWSLVTQPPAPFTGGLVLCPQYWGLSWGCHQGLVFSRPGQGWPYSRGFTSWAETSRGHPHLLPFIMVATGQRAEGHSALGSQSCSSICPAQPSHSPFVSVSY